MHHNSQKRIHLDNYGYFITTTTHKRFPYFKEKLFCKLLVENLMFAQKLKEFELLGHTTMSDHIHLLIKPNGKYSISQIMQFIKRHFTRDANFVITGEGDIRECRLWGGKYETIQDKLKVHDRFVNKVKERFIQKHKQNQIQFPPFKWQKSFRDHIIRNEKNLYNHLEYIQNNWIKHEATK